ncbi:MAG: hypothetical protein PUP92_25920, partial [Rhizonema sp. PD38]|nr:hypothetical protein [Rhizonema sp. PD38]
RTPPKIFENILRLKSPFDEGSILNPVQKSNRIPIEQQLVINPSGSPVPYGGKPAFRTGLTINY